MEYIAPKFFEMSIQKLKEGNYISSLESTKPKRSMSQNALYWLYLEIISNETGNYPEDLHEFFKRKFLPRKIVKIQGKNKTFDLEKIKSTTKLDKTEFGEYLKKIESLTGVPIPDTEKWLFGEKE